MLENYHLNQNKMKIYSYIRTIVSLLALPLLLIIGSCFDFGANDDTKYPFDEKELHFVAYAKDQSLSFIDTTNIRFDLVQKEYRRDFREYIGYWGGYGFYEEYRVEYSKEGTYEPLLEVDLDSFNSNLRIEVWGYISGALITHNSGAHPQINISHQSITINGNNYHDVYEFKAYRQNRDTTDSAILYWNKAHGVIQLLLKNGKTVTRVE